MASIPPIRRLAIEDFQGQPWAEKLISPLNSFMEQVRNALFKGLTVADNMNGAIKTVEIDGTYPVKIAWDLQSRPQTVIIGNIYRTDGANFTLTGAVFPQWSFNQDGQLQIDNVAGGWPTDQSPSVKNKYKLTLECKVG